MAVLRCPGAHTPRVEQRLRTVPVLGVWPVEAGHADRSATYCDELAAAATPPAATCPVQLHKPRGRSAGGWVIHAKLSEREFGIDWVRDRAMADGGRRVEEGGGHLHFGTITFIMSPTFTNPSTCPAIWASRDDFSTRFTGFFLICARFLQ